MQLYSIKNVMKKWYNNLGWITYSLGDYKKSNSLFDLAVRFDEPNEEDERIESENPHITKNLGTEKSTRLLNYSLSLIRYGKSWREQKEQQEWYVSADMKLNKIVKSYSNSSMLSELEMLSLVASTYVKLKLKNFEESKMNIRSIDALISRWEEQNIEKISEVLKQYRYYFDAKLNIYEVIEINNIKNNAPKISSAVSEVSYGTQMESFLGISELADDAAPK